MFYILQLIMIAYVLFKAGDNSSAVKLRENEYNSLTMVRITRWHRDGSAGYAILLLVIAGFLFKYENWLIAVKSLVAGALIMVTFFDVALNNWSGWKLGYMGNTAWWDRFFVKLFGKTGAVKKAIAFFILLVILNLVNEFYTIALNLFS